MTKTWEVILPITGVLVTSVETDDDADEDDAIEAALTSELKVDLIETWEAHKSVCQGNVYHGERNDAEAFEVE